MQNRIGGEKDRAAPLLNKRTHEYINGLSNESAVADERKHTDTFGKSFGNAAGRFHAESPEPFRPGDAVKSAGHANPSRLASDGKSAAAVIGGDARNERHTASDHSGSGQKQDHLWKIGHEINNFLTVLNLRCEMVRTVIDDKKRLAENLDRFVSNLNGLKRYANNLLFLGKNQSINRASIDIADYFREKAENLYASQQSAAVTVLTDTESIWIHADRDILTALFDNLVLLFELTNRRRTEHFIEITEDTENAVIQARFKSRSFPADAGGSAPADRKDMKLSAANLAYLAVLRAAEYTDGACSIETTEEESVQLNISIPLTHEETISKKLS